MVLCKFFQQGYCKFGDNCRYEHSSGYSQPRQNDYYQDHYKYGRQSVKFETHNRFSAFNDYDNGGYSRNNDYRTNDYSRRGDYNRDSNYSRDVDYNRSSGNRSGDYNKGNDYSQSRKTSKAPSIQSDAQITFEDFVTTTVSAIEVPPSQQKVWPLSCFGPMTGGDNYPDLQDVSPEELRWECLQNQSQGTFGVYVQKVQQMMKNNEVVINSIIHKSNDALMNLKNIYQAQKFQSQSQSATFGHSNFSQSSNIGFEQNQFENQRPQFGNQSNSGPFPSNVFQPPTSQQFEQPTAPPSIFGSINNSHSSSQSIFGVPPSQNQTPSAVASFQNSSNNTFPNTNNTLSTAMVKGTSGTPSSFSAANNIQAPFARPSNAAISHLHTPFDSINDEERQHFAAESFVLGKIPIKPPPMDFC